MSNEFSEWYTENTERFHRAHMTDLDIARLAWIESTLILRGEVALLLMVLEWSRVCADENGVRFCCPYCLAPKAGQVHESDCALDGLLKRVNS